MEFKGTKEKWELTHNKRGIEVYIKPRVYKSICSSTGNTKWQYDMLLISKAPEMLEMLQRSKDKLYTVQSPSTSCRMLGDEIEQLIKEATEF